jgi:itaconate CoA-transferase
VLGTTNDREWQRLAADVLGRPDLARDPRYATNADRCARRAELDAVIAGWAAGLPLAACRAAAEAASLGHARLNRPTEILDHPQLAQRDRWREIGSPAGPVLGLLPPPVADGWDWRLDPIPALGEHTVPVLRELGFADDEVAAMRAAGVIGEP